MACQFKLGPLQSISWLAGQCPTSLCVSPLQKDFVVEQLEQSLIEYSSITQVQHTHILHMPDVDLTHLTDTHCGLYVVCFSVLRI